MLDRRTFLGTGIALNDPSLQLHAFLAIVHPEIPAEKRRRMVQMAKDD